MTQTSFTLLLVFVGGLSGAWLRNSLPELSPGLPQGPGTSSLLPNGIACLLIGALHASRSRLPDYMPALCIVGFCGGLSTFSTFALDIAMGLSSGALAMTLGSGLFELVLGILLVLAGHAVMRRLLRASSRC